MKKCFLITSLLSILILLGCTKTDNSLPESVATTTSTPVSNPTNFVFTGTMMVDKYDSNNTAITNYPLLNVVSSLHGVKPSFQLNTNVNGEALKGEISNSIDVSITNITFSSFASGTGIFSSGVYNGSYTSDSLYYTVLYKDAYKNNIYLNYSGQLTSSY
tara:strand:- start:3919 stop:4398 length:480 start_codon:yes stop_codon:yes gene_type:complete